MGEKEKKTWLSLRNVSKHYRKHSAYKCRHKRKSAEMIVLKSLGVSALPVSTSLCIWTETTGISIELPLIIIILMVWFPSTSPYWTATSHYQPLLHSSRPLLSSYKSLLVVLQVFIGRPPSHYWSPYKSLLVVLQVFIGCHPVFTGWHQVKTIACPVISAHRIRTRIHTDLFLTRHFLKTQNN